MLIETALANSITVSDIQVVGNEKTRASTIIQEIPFEVGDVIEASKLYDAKQAILDLSLFSEVEIERSTEQDGDVLTIRVVEKRYNFILPKLNRNGDGDVKTGVVWRTDNLFGLNQQSKLTLAYTNFSDSDEERETELSWKYHYPRISGTPYSVRAKVEIDETTLTERIDDMRGRYNQDHSEVSVTVGKWLSQKGPSQGLQLQGGFIYEDYQHQLKSGTDGLLPNVMVFGLTLGIENFEVHDRLLSRSGIHYGYRIKIADTEIGSDISFVEHTGFFRKYIPLESVEHSNLNIQFVVGTINRSVLGTPHFSAAGSRALRGYDRESVEGNSFMHVNLEYLRPIFNKETLRGALVFDVGNAWRRASDVSLSDLRYSAGIGLRWKLKRFVKTDIRLDIVEGLSDEGETKAYLGTNATF